MKHFSLTLLIVVMALLGFSQTQPSLPPGSTAYSSALYKAPNGFIWTGKPGNYTNLGLKTYADTLTSKLAGKILKYNPVTKKIDLGDSVNYMGAFVFRELNPSNDEEAIGFGNVMGSLLQQSTGSSIYVTKPTSSLGSSAGLLHYDSTNNTTTGFLANALGSKIGNPTGKNINIPNETGVMSYNNSVLIEDMTANDGAIVSYGWIKQNITGNLKVNTISLNALNAIPASATAPGTQGEIRFTTDHLYLCVDTNVWVRAAFTTW